MNTVSRKQSCRRPDFNQYYWAFCITLIFLFTAAISYAAVIEHRLEIRFFFDTGAIQDKLVTEYRLYKEGDLVCETQQVEPQIQTVACTILSENGTYPFTLSALFSDHSESSQSGAFMFTLALKGDLNNDNTVDLKDVIVGLQALTNLSPNSSQPVKEGDVNRDGKIGLAEVLYCLKNAL